MTPMPISPPLPASTLVRLAVWVSIGLAAVAGRMHVFSAPPVDEPAPEYYALLCAPCHGTKGEGNREIGAPSLAGLPDWYVVAQMEKFRNGQRGLHPDDREGALMRAIALSVNEEMLQGALGTILSLDPRPTVHKTPEDGDAPDLKTGEFLYYAAECAACHRYNGSGELVFASPPLTNLPDWYIARQLVKFAEGVRGYHPEDIGGIKMQPFSRSVIGEADLDDLLAFIANLAKKYPPESDRPPQGGDTRRPDEDNPPALPRDSQVEDAASDPGDNSAQPD